MDEEPDFERDLSIAFPDPLDPHIANIWLHADVNCYSEGYPLKLSASFGEEFVTLGDGDLTIPVKMSLRKAAISINFSGCIVESIQDGIPDQYRLASRYSRSKGKELGGGFDGGLDKNGLAGKVGGKGNVSSIKTESHDESFESGKPWRRTTEHSLEIARENSSLSRELISRQPMWFVRPHPKAEKVQVLAVLSARAEWIKFGKVDTEAVAGKSAGKFVGWWRRASRRDKELYRLLMSKLAEKGLQSPGTRDATLAIYPHALRKYDPTVVFTVPAIPPSGARDIPIDTTSLIEFTQATPEAQIDILNKHKVPMGAMNRILVMAKERQAPQRGIFNAGSAPPTALKALITCVEAEDGRLSKTEWDSLNRNRSRQDLVALNLISVDDDIVISLVPDGVDPEDALRYEARKAPMLQKAREVLLENPNANGIEIGEVVGRAFDRRYDSDKSKLRVGNALRRWAFWLEEDLIDPRNSQGLARLRASARSERPGIGAPTAATNENLAIAQDALDRGERPKDIAKRMGVSRSTFYGWASRGLLSLPSKRKNERE